MVQPHEIMHLDALSAPQLEVAGAEVFERQEAALRIV